MEKTEIHRRGVQKHTHALEEGRGCPTRTPLRGSETNPRQTLSHNVSSTTIIELCASGWCNV